MNSIYGLQLLMLMTALLLLFIPFRNKEQAALKNYFLVAAFTLLFSLGVYQLTTDTHALKLWLAEGKQHYQLLEKFNALGGVDGAIVKVKEKLALNPHDKQGWVILGKLYLSKNDKKAADEAFVRAEAV